MMRNRGALIIRRSTLATGRQRHSLYINKGISLPSVDLNTLSSGNRRWTRLHLICASWHFIQNTHQSPLFSSSERCSGLSNKRELSYRCENKLVRPERILLVAGEIDCCRLDNIFILGNTRLSAGYIDFRRDLLDFEIWGRSTLFGWVRREMAYHRATMATIIIWSPSRMIIRLFTCSQNMNPDFGNLDWQFVVLVKASRFWSSFAKAQLFECYPFMISSDRPTRNEITLPCLHSSMVADHHRANSRFRFESLYFWLRGLRTKNL
jgi:hypothetical protein